MCIRRQEGCYLSQAEPQSLKNSTRATQWSVPCPSLPPYNSSPPMLPPKGKQAMSHLPMRAGQIYLLPPSPSICSYWPHYITTPDNLKLHAPEQTKLFLPETPALLLTLPWLHHLQRQWDSGSNHLPFCQCGEKQHANWAYQSLEVRIRLQAKLEMLVIVYEQASDNCSAQLWEMREKVFSCRKMQ